MIVKPLELDGDLEPPGFLPRALRSVSRWLLPVACLYVLDKLLHVALLAVAFPAPLIGMAAIVAALLAAHRWRPAAAEAAAAFFRPGVDWVAHQWLILFYIPALVSLPLAVAPLSGADLAKAAGLVCAGVPAVLCFTAGVAVLIRRATKSAMEHYPYHAAMLEVAWLHWAFWGFVAGLALVLATVLPPSTGPFTAFPFLLSVTVLGYLAGLALPRRVQAVIHPILVCGAAPNAGAALHGQLTGAGYWATLRSYLTKGHGPPAAFLGYGPGDLLFSFLGVIILSFAFKIYEQWPIMRRHAAEIVGSTASSALFSMLTTAGMARLAGLPPDVARGMVPRSVTMALALPIATQLDAPQPITAAAVALTGIAGSALVVPLLNAARFRDPIARGLAAAASAHGLGTAALAAREPEALPYAALSYAACGVLASALAALPPLRALLLAITG